jgi:Flp pilus assembly protein TadG
MAATSRAVRRGGDPERGAVTVEAAIALCGFVAVLVVVLAGQSAVLAQLRCVDAAEQAARLVARGDGERAHQIAARLAPSGASVRISDTGDTAAVSVQDDPFGGLLPILHLDADAYAVLEPAPPADVDGGRTR